MGKIQGPMRSCPRTKEIRVMTRSASQDGSKPVQAAPRQAIRTAAARIARVSPRDLTPQNVLQLQNAAGNRVLGRLLARSGQLSHQTNVEGSAARGRHMTARPTSMRAPAVIVQR